MIYENVKDFDPEFALTLVPMCKLRPSIIFKQVEEYLNTLGYDTLTNFEYGHMYIKQSHCIELTDKQLMET